MTSFIFYNNFADFKSSLPAIKKSTEIITDIIKMRTIKTSFYNDINHRYNSLSIIAIKIIITTTITITTTT